MQLCKLQIETGEIRIGAVVDEHVSLLDSTHSLGEVLHARDPAGVARELVHDNAGRIPLADATLLAPIDRQEVWAAGVTYKRSQEARERESVGAARFYDLVYTAARPELFFKSLSSRVAGPAETVRIRRDSRWSVPEPELAVGVSPHLRIV